MLGIGEKRYDVVIYGATGFTGTYVVEVLNNSKYANELEWAVAGRNEEKLRKVLADVSERTGKDVRDKAIIIADSGDEQSLAEMAKQAKVIVNTVGPFRLYGEAVVKAAVENKASHVDISGEPKYLESMQLKYNDLAKENGVYIVGACGWDSIPCDLGCQFTKDNFKGDINHIETFVETASGPAGYSLNTGTYQSMVLGISEMGRDGLGKIRRTLMPEKLVKSEYRPQKRSPMFKHEGLNSWCLPFLGSDKSVVGRSMYYAYQEHKERPFYIETFLRMPSLFWSILLILWLSVFAIFARFSFTRKILQKYPEISSFNLFKKSGPTREQVSQSSFVYWFFGRGWADKLGSSIQHLAPPNQDIIVRCDGPDAGYVATSGCILSSAITILKDRSRLPSSGGVFTPASIFDQGTKIYDRLKEFGVTFKVVDKSEIRLN